MKNLLPIIKKVKYAIIYTIINVFTSAIIMNKNPFFWNYLI